jgi:PPK2 family polyphosphate:nucleotide phosphotransferase
VGGLDHKRLEKLVAPLRVPAGKKVSLPRDFDPGYTADFVTKEDAQADLLDGVEILRDYQERLAAQDVYALLVVLQGLDASGKDGTIEHVMSGVNPQGVAVTSFKTPSTLELDHDFLWRHQVALPGRGQIGIFNRSHYEEVLVVRVHPQYLQGQRLPAEDKTDDIWERRYREINEWERHLVDNGTRVVKLFLNVSKEEQRKQFLERLDDPTKSWKFSPADVAEREFWDDYQKAYAAMLGATSTAWAPWHVIPADHKWFARLAAAAVIISALIDIDPRFPVADDKRKGEMAAARSKLAAQASGKRAE